LYGTKHLLIPELAGLGLKPKTRHLNDSGRVFKLPPCVHERKLRLFPKNLVFLAKFS
jgi:hypothetical protein